MREDGSRSDWQGKRDRDQLAQREGAVAVSSFASCGRHFRLVLLRGPRPNILVQYLKKEFNSPLTDRAQLK